MMKMRKSRLGVAVAAALGAAMLAPGLGWGSSIDVRNASIEPESGGDSLLFPIYSTAEGATSSFSVANTTENTVLAKIRFREQEHSMDVLDFMVVFSPYDKFDFSVGQGDPRPIMRWTKDNSCVIGPSASAQAAHAQMFPPKTEFVSSTDAMTVGHLEVLGLVSLDDVCLDAAGNAIGESAPACDGGISAAAAAKHGAGGTPANCGVLQSLLGSQSKVNNLKNIGSTGPVYRSLIGRYVITDAAGGIEAGADAIELRHTNFGPEGADLLSAQSSQLCSASSNCTSNYAWDTKEYDHPHFGEMGYLVGLEQILTASTLSGDWSNNETNFVGVDWIASFPTLYAYLDYIAEGKCHNSGQPDGPGTTKVWCLKNPNPGWVNGENGPAMNTFTVDNTTQTCLEGNSLDMWGYDEEESSHSGVSPGGTTLNLCNEVNIFALSDESQTPRASVIQSAARRTNLTGDVGAVRGWAQLYLGWPDGVLGGAITGDIFTTRATTQPENNNGSLTELKKDVGYPPNEN
jgi:hypothetical protein